MAGNAYLSYINNSESRQQCNNVTPVDKIFDTATNDDNVVFIPTLTNISHQCNEDNSHDPANYCNHVPLTSNAQTYSGLC